LIDFHQNWHRRENPQKKKTSSLGINIAPLFPLFTPKTHILGHAALKTHANIKPMLAYIAYALNLRASPKFRVLKEIGLEEHDGVVSF